MNEHSSIAAERASYLGIVESAAGATLVCVADSEEIAQAELYALWRKTVYELFEPGITNFAELAEWNGSRVIQVPRNQAINWDMFEPPAKS